MNINAICAIQIILGTHAAIYTNVSRSTKHSVIPKHLKDEHSATPSNLRENFTILKKCYFFSHFTFDNNGMKSSKHQATFLSLIFLLKCFPKSTTIKLFFFLKKRGCRSISCLRVIKIVWFSDIVRIIVSSRTTTYGSFGSIVKLVSYSFRVALADVTGRFLILFALSEFLLYS